MRQLQRPAPPRGGSLRRRLLAEEVHAFVSTSAAARRGARPQREGSEQIASQASHLASLSPAFWESQGCRAACRAAVARGGAWHQTPLQAAEQPAHLQSLRAHRIFVRNFKGQGRRGALQKEALSRACGSDGGNFAIRPVRSMWPFRSMLSCS